jgi:hypothetical protein
MKRLSLTLIGSLGVLLLASAGARATPTTLFITENWAPGAPRLFATGFSSGNDHYISFSNESAVTVELPVNGALPPAAILASNLKTVSSGADLAHADHVNSDYTLSMVVTDNASNATGTLTFKGHLMATFWKNYAAGGNFYYDASNNHVQSVTQSLVLNGNTIFVTLNAFTSFSNPNSQNNGSIGGVMYAQTGTGGGGPGPTGGGPGPTGGGPGPNGGGPGPNGSPEPSTLVMSFLGLSGLGLASWRKWRAGKPA